MKLATAETFYPAGPKDGAERVLNIWLIEGKRPPIVPMTEAIDPSVEVTVRVNHGRWIADCPTCAGAQTVSILDHRFFCIDCGNAAVGGRWLRTRWPTEAMAINEILRVRPTENRNWRPEESLALLRDENAEHGLGGR